MRFIILDIDNCIADDAWRIPRINWQSPDPIRRYHDYHSLSPWDEVRNRDLLADPSLKRVFFTGRPVFYKTMTLEWLRRNGIQHSFLIMRNDADQRPSAALKQWQLEALVDSYGVQLRQIDLAVDDLPAVVEMYQRFGLPAEVRSIHATSSYLNPVTGINHANGERFK